MIAKIPTIVTLRHHARTILGPLALAILVIELGGIWNELHQLRSEQVKNALFALPEGRRASIRKTPFGRKLESTVNVEGSVEVEGDVKIGEPVEVEIEH